MGHREFFVPVFSVFTSQKFPFNENHMKFALTFLQILLLLILQKMRKQHFLILIANSHIIVVIVIRRGITNHRLKEEMTALLVNLRQYKKGLQV